MIVVVYLLLQLPAHTSCLHVAGAFTVARRVCLEARWPLGEPVRVILRSSNAAMGGSQHFPGASHVRAAPLVLVCFQTFFQRRLQRLPRCSLINDEGLEGAGQEYQILPNRPVVRIGEVSTAVGVACY